MDRDLHTINRHTCAEKPDRYLRVYEKLLSPLRHAEVSLLELGIREGGSIKLWDAYFPHAEVFGLDLVLPDMPDGSLSDRVTLIQGSQDDASLLEEVAGKTRTGRFDIVIDDASHVGKLTKVSFWTLFPMLQRGGLYIIEDWGTGLARRTSEIASMTITTGQIVLEKA